ncbi:MAG: FAD-binding domain-containing protein [Fimbriiglobus sp.]
MTPSVVWWVKRDARLADNAVLNTASAMGASVAPIFVFEPSIVAAADTSAMHIHAQWQALTHLREQLRQREADIVIAHGEAVEKLDKLHTAHPFTHLFSHEEVGNDLTFQRDRAVANWCRDHGIQYREFPQSSVRRTGVNRDRLQQLWQTRIVQKSPLAIPTIQQSPAIRQLAMKTDFPKFEFPASARHRQPVSERDAHDTLADFLHRRGVWYRGGISSPNTADTAGSRLSVHLAWGTITARQVWHAVRARLADLDPDDPQTARWKRSLEAFLSRLHWRDHFSQRLESEPELEFRSIHSAYRDIPYENNERLYEAWRDGRTGYPMVDAVMRCLAATGFVNFRMRAMAVSFACHVLHLDWRLIHPHLACVFRDYDPGIHLSQLQMQAGVVGWNAIRVYSPQKQLQDWDSQGRFVKRWLPELRDVAIEKLLAGEATTPIVEFESRSKWMKDTLYAIRKSTTAKAATPSVYLKHGSRKKEQSFRPRRTPKRQPPTKPPQKTLFDD